MQSYRPVGHQSSLSGPFLDKNESAVEDASSSSPPPMSPGVVTRLTATTSSAHAAM